MFTFPSPNQQTVAMTECAFCAFVDRRGFFGPRVKYDDAADVATFAARVRDAPRVE